jgi:hypothetical protein
VRLKSGLELRTQLIQVYQVGQQGDGQKADPGQSCGDSHLSAFDPFAFHGGVSL